MDFVCNLSTIERLGLRVKDVEGGGGTILWTFLSD